MEGSKTQELVVDDEENTDEPRMATEGETMTKLNAERRTPQEAGETFFSLFRSMYEVLRTLFYT